MRKLLIWFIVLGLCFCPASTFAQEEGLTLLAKGKYFSIYGYRQLDIAALLQKINFTYLGSLNNLGSRRSNDLSSLLAEAIDNLYSEVSDILDIHVYSYHGDLKILPDQSSLSSVFRNYFGSGFSERSFYLHPRNTIYISFRDLTEGMLGHEISHAIISHYFVVPPPAKVQEVLSGYIEYTILKKSKSVNR
ncbi:MAG: hypothetical protein ABIH45_04180 [Candidatus Omnitrophota bacterium]